MNDQQIQDRRRLITWLLLDAVSSVQNEGGTFIDVRCTGEVVVGGSHIVVGDVDAIVYREDFGTVTRKKVLLDDVVSVETFWGAPPQDDKPRPIHIAPSVKEATILSMMIEEAVREVPQEALEKAKIAHIVHIARVGDEMLDGPATARYMREALMLLPDLVRLRGDRPAYDSVCIGATAFMNAMDAIRVEGLINRDLPVHTSSVAKVLDLLTAERIAEISASIPMVAGNREQFLNLPTEVVLVLDAAATLAAILRRFMNETEPFARFDEVRPKIREEMARWFVPRG